MQVAKFATVIGLATAGTLALADDKLLTVGRSISRQEMLQRVHSRFDKLCKPNAECAVGIQAPTGNCPFVFVVIVPLPDTEPGKRSLAIWLSLDHLGRVMAASETRDGACASV